MPLYEYWCDKCQELTSEFRRIDARDNPMECWICKKPADRIVSSVTMHSWNAERRFPNLSPHGDGTKTFKSKIDYEVFLKENHIVELSQGGRLKRPHGNKVIGKWH